MKALALIVALIAALVPALTGGAVLADAPASSLRPQVRPGLAQPAMVPVVSPDAGTAPVIAEPVAGPPRFGPSLRPQPRPERIASQQRGTGRKAAIIAPAMPQSRADKGGLCGDPALQGSIVGRISGGSGKGCGVDQGVRLTAISGVRLSRPATVDCATASAMKTWITKGLMPALGNTGGGVNSIQIMASYTCRTRNNQKGARISEHGRGRALDIGGFTLKNGQQISVLSDWGKGRHGKALRQMHRAACGPFGTVLGPEANRFHRDHFHFDTARYRSGSYCK